LYRGAAGEIHPEEDGQVMRKLKRATLVVAALAVIAVVVSACGSGSSTGSSGSGSTAKAPATVGGLKQTGPGLTAPTAPTGAKISGGTVSFSEGPSAPPNYIFPMYSPQYCGTNNIDQLNVLLYRPLYWYGDNYSPTVDYDKSIGQQPAVSNGGKTYTIHLNSYKWSNGETVTARDLVFWMNVLKASPATEWCGYVPGLFPDNVSSYSAPNASTFVITFTKSYNPTFVLYNELSQIYPLPLAWDRTSLSQPAPTSTSANLPDAAGKASAAKVYSFLNTQGAKIATWSTSPLWTVVDGPFKVSSVTSDGGVTFVPNPSYSGSPKPSISKFVEVPFTADSAVFNEVRSGGPSALTIANLPAQYVPQLSTVESEGYTDNTASSYSVNYFPLNENNPKVGPIFKQLYFRQAFDHLVDQDGWASAFLHNTAVPTYGPVPTAPASPLVSGVSATAPFPFSTADAAKLLTSNGWKVVPGGSTSCIKPGTAAGDCGADITQGETIAFNLDYQSGVATLTNEMNDLAAQAKKVGITLNLTEHPFDDVYSAAVHCTSTQPKCSWTAENWGAGWIYGPDYLPTGEDLFYPNAAANYENYNNPQMTSLIEQTWTDPQSTWPAAMAKFVKYAEEQAPAVFNPTSIGTYQGDGGTLISSKLGGYSANALGFMTPENWYLTK
jgi:peptide/nickel transport system substrate-binding protein